MKFTRALFIKFSIVLFTFFNSMASYCQVYTPPIKVDPMSSVLIESSGLQWAGNSLWSFNDGGGAAAIYRIDTVTNTVFQTVNLSGATNVDWEDIAFDGTYFYIGDFGNNANGARTDLKIYKFPLSAIPDYVSTPTATISSAQVEVISFTYSDQAQPPVASSPNNTKFDCEAMIVDGGKIHLFTKNWVDATTTHYVINSLTAGSYTASPLETLATNYLVTAADKAVGQETIALLGYQASGAANHYVHLLSGYSAGNFFNGTTRKINLPNATQMGQGEGLTFRNGTYGYISNERFQYPVGASTVTVNQKLRSFDADAMILQSVLALDLKSFTVSNVSGMNKVVWDFDSPVENAALQYSSDGLGFSTIKTFSNSASDFLVTKPLNTVNYYRLSWQRNDGAIRYSNVISIKNEVSNTISNLVLKSNGELSFVVNGNEQSYAFELVSSDGKIISQTLAGSYKPGRHTIRFVTNPITNLVFVTAYSATQKTTTLLHVLK